MTTEKNKKGSQKKKIKSRSKEVRRQESPKELQLSETLESEILEFLEKQKTSEKIEDALQEYPELTPRERDFAQRYALETRTITDWATFYNISNSAVYRMLRKPEIRSIINKVKYDFRTFMLFNHMRIVRMAQDAFIDILNMETTIDTAEVKRKAASDAINFWSNFGEENQPTTPKLPNGKDTHGGEVKIEDNVLITPEGEQLSLEDLERRSEELTEMREQMKVYKAKKNGKR